MATKTLTAVKKPKLTTKQIKFVKGIAQGKTPTQSAVSAYPTQKYTTAAVTANENLNKPNVKLAVELALKEQGLSADDMVKPVKRALEYRGDTERDSLDMNLKGVDRLVKLFQMTEDKTTTSPNTVNFNFGSKAYLKTD